MFANDNRRKGRERYDVDIYNFNTALKKYDEAPPEKKAECALAVLSNVAATKKKLSELIDDPEKAKAIRKDAGIET